MIGEQRDTACPLCGSRDSRPRFRATDRLFRTTARQFQVVECASCGVLFLAPRPSTEELAAYYPEGYWWKSGDEGGAARRLEGWYRNAVLRDHVAFVTRVLPPAPARVLDVGCGSGDLLAALLRRGYSCTGLDSSLPALAAARAQGIDALLGDYHSGPLRAESFDAVSMFHFLEHLPDPRYALEFARNVLRPAGRLVVQVPNAASWQCAALGARWSGLDVPRHLVNFRQADLERVVKQAGFRILARKHFSLRDNPAALATSLAPGLEPVSRRARRREPVSARLALDLAYFGLVVAALPLAVAEALAGRGATIMLAAEKC